MENDQSQVAEHWGRVGLGITVFPEKRLGFAWQFGGVCGDKTVESSQCFQAECVDSKLQAV